jgi:uncharacterized protein (DUF302 family)
MEQFARMRTTAALLKSSRPLILIAMMWLSGVQAIAVDGLISAKSSFGPEETLSRLEAAIKAKGLTVFARVDHAAGAAAVGLQLRPTEVVIFGNPRGGTPLMQAAQTAGIDLPLKALIWQDEAGATFLSYNDPVWIAKRHGLGQNTETTVKTISGLLDALVKAATTPP